MENEIVFLSLDKLHSDKKDKDYYKLTCLLDSKNCDVFLSKETYEKLSIRKLEYLKKYIAVFKATNRFGSLSIDLADIK